MDSHYVSVVWIADADSPDLVYPVVHVMSVLNLIPVRKMTLLCIGTYPNKSTDSNTLINNFHVALNKFFNQLYLIKLWVHLQIQRLLHNFFDKPELQMLFHWSLKNLSTLVSFAFIFYLCSLKTNLKYINECCR